MVVSAIDIGTNSVRLLVARQVGETLEPVARALTTTRLGAGLMMNGQLSDVGKKATSSAVGEYLGRARDLQAESIAVFGTSAMREACDGLEYASALAQETGCAVDILSPWEEAKYSYLGATRSLPQIASPLVFDLGGGSCELAWQDEALQSDSLKIGAVYITDAFFHNDPPDEEEVSRAKEHIAKQLSGKTPAGRPLIGVGGTVTTLAALSLKLDPYDPNVVHGFKLTREMVQDQLSVMLALQKSERMQLPGMQAGRAEILPAGTLVVEQMLAASNASYLTVSEGDILLGRLYALISKA